MSYNTVTSDNVDIKLWTNGCPIEPDAITQLKNVASMPFMFKHVAVMPDVHVGMGATIGSVIATKGAIIPAAVGVDIGCGMMATRLSLKASDLPESLSAVRAEIEKAVPVGFDSHTDARIKQYGGNRSAIENHYSVLAGGFDWILGVNPIIETMAKDVRQKASQQLGTLGGGNHFIELCIDTDQNVWVMLHTGSRGIGNLIGRHFIAQAKEEMLKLDRGAPLDKDLSYLTEGTPIYERYCHAVEWAQDYAKMNRFMMMDLVIVALQKHLPDFYLNGHAVNCHHNYVSQENHFGEAVIVTRKGAVRAQKGELGIIPGSMGAKSFIVRGLGNADSFNSCSHGAGRVMSRTKAKKMLTVDDHIAATAGVECRKDVGVIDESPAAYKDIDSVMAAQSDLVEIVHTLKQVLCVKG
jgi:tRNA-splicing ligase RtcB